MDIRAADEQIVCGPRRKRRVAGDIQPPAAPFCHMALGETIVYHCGRLADDRFGNPALDALAREALRLSTAVVEHPATSSAEILTGTGMLELFQRRQPDGTYHYAARRIR